MPYASRQALEARYGEAEIAQRESALPDGALDQILDGADALINGYLATRYVLPLSSVPANLPQYACAIARYMLLGDAATDRARDDHKDAIAWLRDVQSGRVVLQGAANVSGGGSAEVVMVAPTEAVFKRSGRP